MPLGLIRAIGELNANLSRFQPEPAVILTGVAARIRADDTPDEE
jgi:hypothetical protein